MGNMRTILLDGTIIEHNAWDEIPYDEVLTIPGNLELSEKADDEFYCCEYIVAKERGINLNNYKIVKVVPGLRTRGSKEISKSPLKAIDAYELYLMRKNG